MRLSARGEYACLAMIALAQHHNKGPLKIGDIAHSGGIPKKYLEQILLALKHAGYVRSTRGASGGYELSRAPKQISAADVVRLMDGPLAPVGSASKYFYAHTPSERNKPLANLFREVRNVVARKMESTTFEMLAGRNRSLRRKTG